FPHELSGGLRQRVVIAMAIACEPKVLIADEATTALDVTVQAEILDLLRDLRERFGMALLVITHNMGVVADIADRVVVMYEGKVVEQATALDLFARPQAGYTKKLLASVPRLAPGEATRTVSADAKPALVLENLVVEFCGKAGRRFRAVDDL